MADKAKKEEISLEEAAQAFIALHDSGNYNNRRYDRVLGLLRDAVKKDGDLNVGPFVPDPEDIRPELDEEQQAVSDELHYVKLRLDDEVHPGGRLQRAREAVDTILKSAEEGTLALDGGRKLAADAKEAAANAKEEAGDVQKVAVVPATRAVVTAGGDDEAADEKPKKK